MQSRRPSPEFFGLAERLLEEKGASSGGSAEALNGVLRDFHDHLTGLIGDGGFRSLLGLAHLRALAENPALEEMLVTSESNPFLEPSGLGRNGPSHEDGMARASVALIAELLVLVRILARDQNWSVAQLWPGLAALKSAGVSLKPLKPERA